MVDPRRSETAARADLHIAARPGSDVFLLLGLAAHIVQGGLIDHTFVDGHVRETEPLLARLRAVDVEDMAARCEVPAAVLRTLAADFARAPSATIYMDLGLEHGLFSTLTSYLMRVILLLTGNVGNPGGATFHGLFSPRTPARRRAPFRAPGSGIESIEALGPLGMFSPNLLAEEILTDRPGRIRAAIVEGANPAVQYADSQKCREALSKLELLVVIEPAMTESARLAHYVLPTPVGYEKWEYAGFPKHYPQIHAQLRPPVVEGPAAALPEAEIYARLAAATGLIKPAPALLHKLARGARQSGLHALAYLSGAVALATARGGSLDAITGRLLFWVYETLGPQLPAPALSSVWLFSQLFAATRAAEVLRSFPAQRGPHKRLGLGNFLFEQLLSHPEGTEVGCLDTEHNLSEHIRFSDRKVRLSPEPMLRELERALSFSLTADASYPFVLNGGRRTPWNANTVQRDPAWRKGKGPHCALFIHPSDAERLALVDGSQVRVETRRGAVELPVRRDASMRVGHLAIPNGFGLAFPDPKSGVLTQSGVGINELTDARDRDPFTGSPHHKFVRCRLVPVQGTAS